MNLINLTINNNKISVPEGTTILEAAKQINIYIPSLCYLNMKDINMVNQCASCRICMVSTQKGLVPACSTLVTEDMIVQTNTNEALKARKTVAELMLSDHPKDCLCCDKNGQCELQKIAADLGIRKIRYNGRTSRYEKDTSSKSIIKDYDKCILCRRCETMCNDIQTVGAISGINRGFNTQVGTFFDSKLCDTECSFCGQCVAVCPTSALTEVNNIDNVYNLLNKKDKTVVVQVAPSVRVALGEEFGLDPGSIATGKIVSALRQIGFKYVFDTNFAADLTILEEASEFLHRLETNENLPILTSCCPAWVNFMEHNYPNQLNLLSSCKSPQGMFSSIAKHYFAPKVLNISPKDIYVVSIMPCVAKKYECSRDELSDDDIIDTDIVITTRELAKIIKEHGIDLVNLHDSDFDNPLGESTGAGTIFGTSGGVLEAALRTSYEWATNHELEDINFTNIRGLDGLKEASIDINGTTINICVVSTLGNARKIMNDVIDGKSKYHIIEVMACPGGCIAGGGQPYHYGNYDIIKSRSLALYKIDEHKSIRKSHENHSIISLYKNFLDKPNSSIAHKYLHTDYFNKSNTYEN